MRRRAFKCWVLGHDWRRTKALRGADGVMGTRSICQRCRAVWWHV